MRSNGRVETNWHDPNWPLPPEVNCSGVGNKMCPACHVEYRQGVFIAALGQSGRWVLLRTIFGAG